MPEFERELDMTYDMNPGKCSISLIIYCACRYILRISGGRRRERAIPVAVDVSSWKETPEISSTGVLQRASAKVYASYAMIQDLEKVAENEGEGFIDILCTENEISLIWREMN